MRQENKLAVGLAVIDSEFRLQLTKSVLTTGFNLLSYMHRSILICIAELKQNNETKTANPPFHTSCDAKQILMTQHRFALRFKFLQEAFVRSMNRGPQTFSTKFSTKILNKIDGKLLVCLR